jgi:ubiquinone/menaquinone biosynthesis C-methylase UbiE
MAAAKNITEENISFYDHIAEQYDQLLQADPRNKQVREKMQRIFIAAVKNGPVLDFGGGTGLDLGWLSKAFTEIYFCEPSAGMRNKSINKYGQDDHIHFLTEGQTNFIDWEMSKPFPAKLNAILCNFAVLNCIEDIESLFGTFSSVLATDGQVFAILVDMNFSKQFRRSPFQAIQSMVLKKAFRFQLSGTGKTQTVTAHTRAALKKAYSPFFNCAALETWPGTGFMFLHLIKK